MAAKDPNFGRPDLPVPQKPIEGWIPGIGFGRDIYTDKIDPMKPKFAKERNPQSMPTKEWPRPNMTTLEKQTWWATEHPGEEYPIDASPSPDLIHVEKKVAATAYDPRPGKGFVPGPQTVPDTSGILPKVSLLTPEEIATRLKMVQDLIAPIEAARIGAQMAEEEAAQADLEEALIAHERKREPVIVCYEDMTWEYVK